MPVSLTPISGLGGKQPAAFLLEAGEVRILFDLGEGPEAGLRPDLSGVGRVDAICLSHVHGDHVGALDLRPLMGNPPVWATEATWHRMDPATVPEAARRVLPLSGEVEVVGLRIATGRNGHAPGGVWLHAAVGPGVLYMGDWAVESPVYPYDPPPQAGLLVTDASYGDRDDGLEVQLATLVRAVRGGAVLPVPKSARGPELALALAGQGFRPKLCPVLTREVEALAADDAGVIEPTARAALATLLRERLSEGPATPSDLVIATGAQAQNGLAAVLLARQAEGFRFVFTGHVAAGSPAARLMEGGEARFLRWNVHPRFHDTLALIRQTGAEHVVPAFVAPEKCQALQAEFGGRLHWARGEPVVVG